MSLPQLRRRLDVLEDPTKNMATMFGLTTPMFMSLREACERLGRWPEPGDIVFQLAILDEDEEPY